MSTRHFALISYHHLSKYTYFYKPTVGTILIIHTTNGWPWFDTNWYNTNISVLENYQECYW